MRTLLNSSWIQFGPAGRSTYDWVARASVPSSEGAHLQDYELGELTSRKAEGMELTLYSVMVTGSLLLLGFIAFLVYKWCSRPKLNGTKIITLDLDSAGGNVDALPALASDKPKQRSDSVDTSDGVFLMLYLPSPYQETLSRIARAASTSSSNKEPEISELDIKSETEEEEEEEEEV